MNTTSSETGGTDAPPSDAGALPLPLCVDLDDTLLRTDLLHEGLVLLARDAPAQLLNLPAWLRRGKASFKSEVAKRVAPVANLLPYRASVLDLIIAAKQAGRPVLLVTASPQAWADAIAEHLGLFTETIASDASRNVSCETKRDILVERFGVGGYEYIGDSRKDIPVWQSAKRGWIVNDDSTLVAEVAAYAQPLPGSARSNRSREARWMKALRVHQWSKNLLLFVPLVMAHALHLGAIFRTILALISFSCAASSVYILNDILDLEADRAHPSKQKRPFASGEIPLQHGAVVCGVLFLISLIVAIGSSSGFFVCLLLYLATTTSYSSTLKRIPIVDIFVLASLYTLRVFAGAFASRVEISPWLIVFCLFFFLGLAAAKRYVELDTVTHNTGSAHSRRGYIAADKSLISTLGLASGMVSVLVLALYIQAPEVVRFYRHPWGLWIICPLVLLWIARVWFLAHRQILHEDPVVFALHDRASLIVGLLTAIAVCVAT